MRRSDSAFNTSGESKLLTFLFEMCNLRGRKTGDLRSDSSDRFLASCESASRFFKGASLRQAEEVPLHTVAELYLDDRFVLEFSHSH